MTYWLINVYGLENLKQFVYASTGKSFKFLKSIEVPLTFFGTSVLISHQCISISLVVVLTAVSEYRKMWTVEYNNELITGKCR